MSPVELNLCAAMLAEALCKGRPREENEEILRFCNLLCTLIRGYL